MEWNGIGWRGGGGGRGREEGRREQRRWWCFAVFVKVSKVGVIMGQLIGS
jgi:hypothetical protein